MADLEAIVPPRKSRARRVRCKLDSLRDCRREAAKLFREGRAGMIDVLDARRLASVLLVVGSLIRDDDLERRIAALEGARDDERLD